MMSIGRKTAIAGVTLAAGALLLTACSPDESDNASPGTGGDGKKLELRVATFPPGADKAAYDAFAVQEKQFEDLNPDIDVIGVEYEWTGPTFAVQLAGGSLPDVFTVPFTDSKTLLENGQLMDVTGGDKDPWLHGQVQPRDPRRCDRCGRQHLRLPAPGVRDGSALQPQPVHAAGLDPNKPPTTWDEIRADAKIIAEKTGKAGYAQMAINNTGGWQLTAETVARGGRTQTQNDDGTFTSTINNPATVSALQFLHDLRWTDNSFGSKYDLDWGTINQEFAAGNIGMYTSGSDVYTALVRDFGMDPAQYGMTVVPNEGADAGTLGGGDVAVISPTVDDATKAAAVKWIDWYYMQKLMNEDAAVADAKALSDAGQAVGTPVLPVLSKDLYLESQTWIAPYINVPVDQMKPFTDNIWNQTPVGEPKGQTQAIYGLLDPVVQSVLTDKNADINALLTKADTDAQALLDQ